MAGKSKVKQANGIHPPKVQNENQNSSPAVEGKTSPVLEAISKRIRNARKRLRGIEDIEAKRDQGRELNPDQEAALASKPALLAVVEELDKLLKTLPASIAEETAAAREEVLASIPEPEPLPPTKTDEEWIAEKEAAISKAVAKAEEQATKKASEAANASLKEGISAVMELIYYANVFDPFMPFPHPAQYERHACLSYAVHKNVQLTAQDLDTLALFGKLLTTKPYGAAISHAEALERCKELAYKYITDPSSTLPGTQFTGKTLLSKLATIASTDFCVVVPRGIPSVQAATATMVGATGGGGVVVPPAGVAAAPAGVETQQQGSITTGIPVEDLKQQPPAVVEKEVVEQSEKEQETQQEEEDKSPQAPPPDAVPAPTGFNLVQHLFGNNNIASGGGAKQQKQQQSAKDGGSVDTTKKNTTAAAAVVAGNSSNKGQDRSSSQQVSNKESTTTTTTKPPRPYYRHHHRKDKDNTKDNSTKEVGTVTTTTNTNTTTGNNEQNRQQGRRGGSRDRNRNAAGKNDGGNATTTANPAADNGGANNNNKGTGGNNRRFRGNNKRQGSSASLNNEISTTAA